MFDMRLVAGVFVLAVGACALRLQAPADLTENCVAYFRAIDEAVSEHEAGDAGAWRLPGFAHLRSTRFLAAFRDKPLDAEQTRDWISRLNTVDARARRVELANLPVDARNALQSHSPFDSDHAGTIARCGSALIERDLAEPERLASIRARSKVPIHYRNWQRIVGLYPITQLFVRPAINSLHDQLSGEFALPLDQLPVRGPLQRYAPAESTGIHTAQVAEILRDAQRNPLLIPDPDSGQLASLFNHFAPIWEFEQLSDDDHVGHIRYDNQLPGHYVDISEPVVYQWVSHTWFNAQPLLQLNYLVWVPARSAESSGDIYAGQFDGLMWRVTLLSDGTPLAFDSVHPCGCYYLLFTGAQAKPRATSNVAEPVLVAQELSAIDETQRMVIRVRARDHYIQRVYPDHEMTGITYKSADYHDLLALADVSGRAHSLFDEQGLLRASDRTERYLLWPFGIASAGAMRRAGTHAIAFVGVRHFDDAHLLEELVDLVPGH